MSGYTRPVLRLVPEEPEQVLRLASYRDQHPGVLIREGTGYWQAQIPRARRRDRDHQVPAVRVA